MFVSRVDDLPEKVAAVRVGAVLIVRNESYVDTIEAICSGCNFRVVMMSEVPAA